LALDLEIYICIEPIDDDFVLLGTLAESQKFDTTSDELDLVICEVEIGVGVAVVVKVGAKIYLLAIHFIGIYAPESVGVLS